MNDLNFYIGGLLLFSVICATGGVFTLLLNDSNISRWEKVARWTVGGGILALIDLLWCVPNARPIVWDWMLPLLYPLAILFTVAAVVLLDYLFARAVGGFLILMAYWLLHDSFTFHTAGSPVFAIFCFILAIGGLFFSGKPYLFRDLMRKVAGKKSWKYSVFVYLVLFSVFSLVAAIIHLAGK